MHLADSGAEASALAEMAINREFNSLSFQFKFNSIEPETLIDGDNYGSYYAIRWQSQVGIEEYLLLVQTFLAESMKFSEPVVRLNNKMEKYPPGVVITAKTLESPHDWKLFEFPLTEDFWTNFKEFLARNSITQIGLLRINTPIGDFGYELFLPHNTIPSDDRSDEKLKTQIRMVSMMSHVKNPGHVNLAGELIHKTSCRSVPLASYKVALTGFIENFEQDYGLAGLSQKYNSNSQD